MTRASAMVMVSGVAAGVMGLLASVAQAMPPVVERVPDNAMVVVTIPSPANLEKNLGALNAAIESTIPVPTVKDLLAMGGLGAGVDTTKSVALVLFAPPPEEIKKQIERVKKGAAGDEIGMDDLQGEDRTVLLVPVSNYGEFVASLGGKTEDGVKVTDVSMPNGEAGFVRDLGGGYAVVGSKKDLVETYSDKAGASPIGKRVGKPGEKLADESDIVTIVNMEQVRPMMPAIIEGMKQGAREQAQSMGADEAKAEKNLAGVIWLLETVSKDAQAMVGGLKFSGAGIAADMNANFTEGTALANAFSAAGKPGGLFGKLPSQAYLLAGAIDINNPAAKQLFKDFVSRTPTPGGEAGMQQAMANLENSKGMAAVVGFPMGGAIAGLLTSTVAYSDVADPATAVATMKQTMLALDGTVEEGMKIKSTYADNGAKVGETPVDVWDMKMTLGEGEENQMAAQGLAFLFGPQGGPGGYVAKTEGGVYTTYAKNSELMGKALDAGKGKGETLDKDAMTKDTAGKLPGGRIAEAYIGTKSLLDLTLPFVGMFGVQVPMDKIPAQMPPVGLGISSDGGQAKMSVFIPAPVIKTSVLVGQGIFEQFEGMGEEPVGDAPEGGGQRGGKSGQPRF